MPEFIPTIVQTVNVPGPIKAAVINIPGPRRKNFFIQV